MNKIVGAICPKCCHMDYNLDKLATKSSVKKDHTSSTQDDITPTNQLHQKHKKHSDDNTHNVILRVSGKHNNDTRSSPMSINKTVTMTDGEMKSSMASKIHSIGSSLVKPKDVSYSPDTHEVQVESF